MYIFITRRLQMLNLTFRAWEYGSLLQGTSLVGDCESHSKRKDISWWISSVALGLSVWAVSVATLIPEVLIKLQRFSPSLKSILEWRFSPENLWHHPLVISVYFTMPFIFPKFGFIKYFRKSQRSKYIYATCEWEDIYFWIPAYICTIFLASIPLCHKIFKQQYFKNSNY